MDLAFIPSPSESVWHIGPVPLRAYALCIIAGIVAAVWITEYRLRRRGAPAWTTVDIAMWAVPFGIIGARIYHVLTSPDAYFGADGDPALILQIWNGGLGIPGAILAGALGAWIGARQRGIPLSMVADCLAPGLPVAHAIGRLGNWFNQELYGGPLNTWWAVEIDEAHRMPGYLDQATYHPTFLYEILWNLGIALLVWRLDKVFKFGRGRAFAIYVLAYGVGRFWIEGVRIDPAEAFLGLRTNQWMSVVIVVGALIYLLRVEGKREVLIPAGDEDHLYKVVPYDSPEAEAGVAEAEPGEGPDDDAEPADEPETSTGETEGTAEEPSEEDSGETPAEDADDVKLADKDGKA